MFDTFREPHFFTFSVIFSHIESIFTFSVEFFSHLATFSHIAAFSHLRVPHTTPVSLNQVKFVLFLWILFQWDVAFSLLLDQFPGVIGFSDRISPWTECPLDRMSPLNDPQCYNNSDNAYAISLYGCS